MFKGYLLRAIIKKKGKKLSNLPWRERNMQLVFCESYVRP